VSAPSQHTVLISPIGDFDSATLVAAGAEINRVYGFQTEIAPLLDEVEFAFDEDRNQYYSTLILERLATRAPSHVLKVLGVTRVDLFIPILTHVYGEAQLGGKACIVSTHRLNEGFPNILNETYNHRVAKESIHELGHTFDLRHCRERNCIMHYSRTVQDVDRKSDQLCRYCKVLLDDELKRLEKSSGLGGAETA
jgi:archaemetzincin